MGKDGQSLLFFRLLIEVLINILHHLQERLPHTVKCIAFHHPIIITSSTSSLSHHLHTLSSRLTPLHLPVSICRGIVPPAPASTYHRHKVVDRSAHAIFAETLAVISILLNNISANTLIYVLELIIRPV